MSYHEYIQGKEIFSHDYPFYSLIQAAMRQADTDNSDRLRMAFPKVYEEVVQRYNAPGGLLEGDPGYASVTEKLHFTSGCRM